MIFNTAISCYSWIFSGIWNPFSRFQLKPWQQLAKHVEAKYFFMVFNEDMSLFKGFESTKQLFLGKMLDQVRVVSGCTNFPILVAISKTLFLNSCIDKLLPIPVHAKCVILACMIMFEGQKLSIDLNFHQLHRVHLQTLNIYKVIPNSEFGIENVSFWIAVELRSPSLTNNVWSIFRNLLRSW